MDILDYVNKKFEAGAEVVLVDFYADWCTPCKTMKPHLENKAREPGVELLKVNVDDEGGCVREFGIRSIPTILVFGKGGRRETIFGAMPNKIDELVAKMR